MRTIQLTTFTTILLLTACEGAESATNLDDPRSFDLRGGATITLGDGAELDADELESREGYGATLTDPLGTKWFVHGEQVDAPTLDEAGFTSFPSGEGVGYLGTVWREGEDSDDCHVYLPVDDDSFVQLSRPATDLDCPEAVDEVADWLPQVEPSGEESFLRAFGDTVGVLNGIAAYSNGTTNTNSGQYSTVGLMWQCVEYANRYFYQKYSHKNLKGTGNANQYFGSAVSKNLVAHTNGVSTVAPAVGDMLVSTGGAFGHIAIVREVGPNYLKVIHQNWSNSASDNSKQLTMSVVNGRYTVGTFSVGYPVQGWLRRAPSCLPSVSSVSPTSAWLGASTQFTANGSCLPTTTKPWIAECANLVVNSVSATQLKFTCTPSYSVGVKAGVIKHNTDGTELRSFAVTVN